MADAQIYYKLDLIVRLVDTTNGVPVLEKQIVFQENGRVVSFLERGDGVYILLNHGRTDTRFTVCANGYEPGSFTVCYEQLSQNFPEVEVPLIPVPSPTGFTDILTLSGNLAGIESVEAVDLWHPLGKILDYQERSSKLRLLESKTLQETSYALVHREPLAYETFQIARKADKKTLRLAAHLQMPWKAEEAVARIIRGRVFPDGRYLLRVRPESKKAEYLVRYVVNGAEKFQKMDFFNEEERKLE